MHRKQCVPLPLPHIHHPTTPYTTPCAQWILRLACICIRSNKKTHLTSSCWQWIPWLDCANVQADLSFYWTNLYMHFAMSRLIVACNVAYFSAYSFLCNLGKQCQPRSIVAKCSIWESLQCMNLWYKNWKVLLLSDSPWKWACPDS